ncbi:MAG: type II secretion system F family protein, partial [Desulfobacteraceae bacterium]
MPVYLWEGKNRSNQIQKGEFEAPNEDAVRAHLNRIRIIPGKIKKKPKDLFENVAFLQPKIKEKDIIVFCRQFSTMIDAGLPIIQCLDILQAQQENPTLKKMIKAIKDSVEGGTTLADSLKRYPQHFDSLFVNMIAAGEAGGILDVILKRLSSYLEKAAKLKRKVKGAMVYPAITIFVATVVVAVLLVFVIPVFQKMFNDAGMPLPGPTMIAISFSEFIKAKIHWIIIGAVLFFIVFTRYYKTERGRLTVDALALRMPVVGILIRKVSVAKFTRTMG